MKTYRPARELLAEIELLLKNNRPSFHKSPLDEVVELLCAGRHYAWMAIYLAVGQKNELLSTGTDPHPGSTAAPTEKTRILISMKLAGHEYGFVEVQSETSFKSEDRVLLENVAGVLARFLAGPGKYIMRKARQTGNSQERTPEKHTVRSAAAGDN